MCNVARGKLNYFVGGETFSGDPFKRDSSNKGPLQTINLLSNQLITWLRVVSLEAACKPPLGQLGGS
jgi:hypothetical protein